MPRTQAATAKTRAPKRKRKQPQGSQDDEHIADNDEGDLHDDPEASGLPVTTTAEPTRRRRRAKPKKRRKKQIAPLGPPVKGYEMPTQREIESWGVPLTDWQVQPVPAPKDYTLSMTDSETESSDDEPTMGSGKRKRGGYRNFALEKHKRLAMVIIDTYPLTTSRSSSVSLPSTREWNEVIGEPLHQEPLHQEPFQFGLLKFPLDIRRQILQVLLVADRPFRVYQKWQKLYRNQPGVNTGILSANKQCHEEGTQVLYGDNTFHYLIRDAAVPWQEDEWAEEGPDGNESDSDYEEDEPRNRRAAPARALHRQRPGLRCGPKTNEGEVLINVRKHLHLFRHLIVEVERNRVNPASELIMAEAIGVFLPEPTPVAAAQDSNDFRLDRNNAAHVGAEISTAQTLVSPQPVHNIHTITLRIAPVWTVPNDIRDGIRVAEWFAPRKQVITALQALTPQFINIDMKMRYLFELYNNYRFGGFHTFPFQEETGACHRLRLDMRHCQVESWERTHGSVTADCMRGYVEMRAINARKILSELQTHILDKCEGYHLAGVNVGAMELERELEESLWDNVPVGELEGEQEDALWNDVQEGEFEEDNLDG